MFDDIVAFAELEHFIDNQVKFYSSGMYVRLGFAVAVNVEPDVLVVDEVLAVGDERFQRKCIDRVKMFQHEGRTIIFVTHSPDQVRAICDQAVVLSDGRLVGYGTPGEAVRIFRENLLEAGDVLSQANGEEPAPAPVPSRCRQPDGPTPRPAGVTDGLSRPRGAALHGDRRRAHHPRSAEATGPPDSSSRCATPGGACSAPIRATSTCTST